MPNTPSIFFNFAFTFLQFCTISTPTHLHSKRHDNCKAVKQEKNYLICERETKSKHFHAISLCGSCDIKHDFTTFGTEVDLEQAGVTLPCLTDK